MNLKTLGQLKAEGVATNLGMTPCDPAFVALVNDAQQELMDAGMWWGTYQRIRICADRNCITWPRSVRNVEAFTACRDGIPVRNQWFEFQTYVRAPATGDPGCEIAKQLLDRGTSPVFSDIVGTNKKLRFFASSATDAGKRILVDATDVNGNRIRTFDSVTGVWVDGEYVTLTNTFATTVNFIQHPIYAITKPITNDVVRMYELDTDTSAERLVGIYEPSEEVPRYRRSYLTAQVCGACQEIINKENDGCTDWPGCGRPLFSAIVRLNFVPVIVDQDFLMIGNPRGLETAMQAIKLRRAENFGGYQVLWRDAIGSMRQWSEAFAGQREKTVINCLPFGSAKFGYVVAGFR